MTIEEARKVIGQNMGFGSKFGGTITDYQALSAQNQSKLSDGVAKYIVANPALFKSDEVISARKQTMSQTFDDAYLDDSFQYGDFLLETVKPVGTGLKSIGDGVFSVANAAKWAIPFASCRGCRYLR